MMKMLSSLNPEDLSFVMLKYQEEYSDEQLAEYFNSTLDEIKEKEIAIITSLRKDVKVKVLKKQ